MPFEWEADGTITAFGSRSLPYEFHNEASRALDDDDNPVAMERTDSPLGAHVLHTTTDVHVGTAGTVLFAYLAQRKRLGTVLITLELIDKRRDLGECIAVRTYALVDTPKIVEHPYDRPGVWRSLAIAQLTAGGSQRDTKVFVLCVDRPVTDSDATSLADRLNLDKSRVYIDPATEWVRDLVGNRDGSDARFVDTRWLPHFLPYGPDSVVVVHDYDAFREIAGRILAFTPPTKEAADGVLVAALADADALDARGSTRMAADLRAVAVGHREGDWRFARVADLD